MALNERTNIVNHGEKRFSKRELGAITSDIEHALSDSNFLSFSHAAARTLDITDLYDGAELVIDSTAGGAGALTITANGSAVLTSAGTYAGSARNLTKVKVLDASAGEVVVDFIGAIS